MVKSGQVTGREDSTNRDGEKTVRLLQTEITSAEDLQTVEMADNFGMESNPPTGSRVLSFKVGNAWRLTNSVTDGTALELDGKVGAKQIYSTDEDGTARVSSVTLDNDGTITLTNTSGLSIIVTSGGKVTISNNDEDLLTLIQDLTDAIKAIKTSGSPANHTVTSASQADIQDVSDRFEDLLE